ncbi:MAG: LptE family protein [Deferribacteres bacterium]|nr:LptE family protein [candidate division KSB1 bacterium]MCB9502552.1 LptE family protein [Deferribacteres bacterium]
MIYHFKFRSFLSGVVLIVFTGCGYYSFSGSTLPHLKTIAIPTFQDDTAEFGVKDDLTNALIDAFSKDNTLKIADQRNADSIITGRLLAVRDGAGAFNRSETVNEIRVTVSVQVKFEDLQKRKIVWEDNLSQVGTYAPNGGSTSNTTREEAITEAISKITEEVLNRSISGW